MGGVLPDIADIEGEGGPFNDETLLLVDRLPLPVDDIEDVIEICRRWPPDGIGGRAEVGGGATGGGRDGLVCIIDTRDDCAGCAEGGSEDVREPDPGIGGRP